MRRALLIILILAFTLGPAEARHRHSGLFGFAFLPPLAAQNKSPLAAQNKSVPAKALDVLSVNGAEWQGRLSAPVLLKLQILLDRVRVSPGEIDANLGENTRKAIAAFREL